MSKRRFVLLETVWIPLGGIATAMLMSAVFGQSLVAWVVLIAIVTVLRAAWAAHHYDEWGPQRGGRS